MQFPSAGDAWTLTLDTAARPKTIDATQVNNATNIFRGIYRFEGDNLIICWRQNDNRPTDFTPGVQGVWYQVYQRQKR